MLLEATPVATSHTCAMVAVMGKIEDIEKAVSKLSPDEFARFRAWFEAFDADCFDEKIERDAKAGRLDAMIEKARANHKAGRRQEM